MYADDTTIYAIATSYGNSIYRNNVAYRGDFPDAEGLQDFKYFIYYNDYSNQENLDAPSYVLNNTLVQLQSDGGTTGFLGFVEQRTADAFTIIEANNITQAPDIPVPITTWAPLDTADLGQPLTGSAAIDGGVPNVRVWDDFDGYLRTDTPNLGAHDDLNTGTKPVGGVGGYTELGATALDETDGVLSVSNSGTVDVGTPGTYVITYTATDAAGNIGTAQRTVIVS